MRHELKCDPIPFEAVSLNLKRVELRKDDREYVVGDELLIRQTVYKAEQMAAGLPLQYTGKESRRVICHIQRGYGLADGVVALSIRPLTSMEKYIGVGVVT